MLNITSLEEALIRVEKSTNDFFILVIGILIVFMQCGFAFLEAGSVRSKNTVNILIKNMLDLFIGGLSYWAIGYGLAFGSGGNPIIGGSNFFSYNMDPEKYGFWFFQFVFAATAATIVSGAIAERCQFTAYFIYSVVLTGVVYPPVSHWAWDSEAPGWLNMLGYQDFAGSGVVHLVGGTCAFTACKLIGPRRGRFDKSGKPINMPGHSVPLAALGGFILIFGFLAFNGGSQGAIAGENDSRIVALAIINTVLGGCGGGLTVLFVNKLILPGDTYWSYLMSLNGSLAGMVSLCAGCNVFMKWAAILVGSIGGVAFLLVHSVMLKFKLDDPLDAVAVHAVGGVVGLITVPFFDSTEGIFWVGDTVGPWKQLGINLLGLLSIVVWSTLWSFVIFYPLKYWSLYRIDTETEFKGNDLVKHGEAAYPAEAWVEQQYERQDESKESIPPNMSSGKKLSSQMSYNDPFEVANTTGKLFKEIPRPTLMLKSMNVPNSGEEESGNEKKGIDNGAASTADSL